MKSYLEHFKEICAIPHGSGNLKGISDYIISVAESLGLEYFRDSAMNVIVYKPASRWTIRRRPAVILQAHMDMVAVCNDSRDMKIEPVKMNCDGKKIWAEGSSLGADNGIGMAYILSILSDNETEMPSIEAVFTADEEVGMTGVTSLDMSLLKGKYLINLDSENEGEMIVSCAGGADVNLFFNFSPNFFKEIKGTRITINLFGFSGGHSGNEIDSGKVSAFKVINEVVHKLSTRFDVYFTSYSGGDARNVIDSSCVVTLVVQNEDTKAVSDFLKAEFKRQRARYINVEKGFDVRIRYLCNSRTYALTNGTEELFAELNSLPFGVLERSPDGEIVSSINFGLVGFDSDVLVFRALARSNDDAKREAIIDKIINDFTVRSSDERGEIVFESHVESSFRYSAWKRSESSILAPYVAGIYKNLFNSEIKFSSIHAGLECGVFVSRAPYQIDAVSIGPTITDAHSVKESISFDSAENCFKLLYGILAGFNFRN